MYSCIFDCKSLKESEGDRSSTTKSGHRGGKLLRSSSLNAFQRSSLIQARSGERSAPFGRMNPVDESNPWPVPLELTQAEKAPVKLDLCFPDSPPVDGI